MCLFALLLAGLIYPALGDVKPASTTGVTYEVRNLVLDRAAAFFERLIRVRLDVDPKLAKVPVTVSIKNLSEAEALQAFVDAARLTAPDLFLEGKEGVYRLRLKDGAPVPAPRVRRPEVNSARKISVAFGNLPLSVATRLIYRQPGMPAGKVPVLVEEAVPNQNVNLVFSDDEEPSLLRVLVRQAAASVRDLRVEENEGRFVVGIRPNAPLQPLPALRGNLPPVDPASRRIALGFREAPLRFVVKAVLGSLLPAIGPTPEYVIDADVPDAPITFTLVTASPEQALETTLAELKTQVKGLTIRTEDGKLHISAPAK